MGSPRDALRFALVTQGGSFLATPGFKMGSLRDALVVLAMVAGCGRPEATSLAAQQVLESSRAQR
jgi:hypothetical protein